MTALLTGFVLLFIYLSTMVAIVQFKGDTSIANFTWGGGVMLVSLYTLFTFSSFLPRQIILTTLMVLWAVRLIVHVYKRYMGKDPRFALWTWKGWRALIINIGWIFGQIIMIVIMSYPVVLVNHSMSREFTYLDIIGLSVWIIGYLFEAISDYQLYVFMRDPTHKGHVMQTGLWRYSRHPNYFGEVLMWWGVYFITLSVPYGWTAIITPTTITMLLLFVTGIPWVEAAMADNPEYQEYKTHTSVFIPWFSKNK